jgi:hypothetical protein
VVAATAAADGGATSTLRAARIVGADARGASTPVLEVVAVALVVVVAVALTALAALAGSSG